MWEYPTNYKDQQNVNIAEQILPISPLAVWDYTNNDKSVLHVVNIDDISECFNSFVWKVKFIIEIGAFWVKLGDNDVTKGVKI